MKTILLASLTLLTFVMLDKANAEEVSLPEFIYSCNAGEWNSIAVAVKKEVSGIPNALVYLPGGFAPRIIERGEVEVLESEDQVTIKDKETAGSKINVLIDRASKKRISKHVWEMPGKLFGISREGSIQKGSDKVTDLTCTWED
jgi:hypothetical protein